MSSRFLERVERVPLFALMLALALASCDRRQLSAAPPQRERPLVVRVSALQPSTGLPSASMPNPYEGNAYALSEGQRLFTWYNCVGCHAHGGGGSGPALMDSVWIYGGSPQQIYASIVQGRPNGMPSFGGHIPDFQVWQLVTYVRSLSQQEPKWIIPARTDNLEKRTGKQ